MPDPTPQPEGESVEAGAVIANLQATIGALHVEIAKLQVQIGNRDQMISAQLLVIQDYENRRGAMVPSNTLKGKAHDDRSA